jgi:non-specific protein-tyrosine kinase
MELKRYIGVLWKWLWMIVLSVGLAAGLSYVATLQQPKLYQATTRIIVGLSYQTANPNPQDFQTSAALASTYIEIAATTPVLQAALDALGIPLAPDLLRQRFHASVVPNTQLIELRVDDTEPQRAQALANELAHQLTLQGPAARQDPQQLEFIQKQADDVERKIVQAQKDVADVQGSIQVTLSARDIASKQQQIATLENQIGQWQSTFAQLQSLLTPRSPNFLSVVEPAQLPTKPYAPNVPLNVLLAAAVGFILSLGATILIEYVDDTLKHPDDAAETLGLPVLGTLAILAGNNLGKSSGFANRWSRAPDDSAEESEDDAELTPPEKVGLALPARQFSDKLVTVNSSRSSQAEAYRVLRTNLQFNGVDKPLRSILVTSASMGEGKSVTAANLAIVMAQAGLRTFLIDADLRKPTQHRLFNMVNNAGLTDSLLARNPEEDFLREPGVDCLSILTSGALPPNPAELLGSQRMRELKKQMEADSDMLIFDGPPCLPVADAAVLANLVDGVVLVVDITRTHRKDALRARDILAKVGARILGVALNRVQASGKNYYYYDYSQEGVKHKKKSKKKSASKRNLAKVE